MSQNIQPGVEFNFRRLSTEEVSSYGVSYDYTSVMHYSGLVSSFTTFLLFLFSNFKSLFFEFYINTFCNIQESLFKIVDIRTNSVNYHCTL